MKERLPIALGLALVLRLWLDLTWVPVSVAQGLTALAGVAFVAVGARRLASHPLRAPLLAFGLWAAVGMVRGGDAEAVRFAAHLLVPLAWLLASEEADERWPVWLLLGGLVPVAASLVALGQGQPAEHVLHGVPRLHGAFRNLHGHAVAMAVLTSVAVWEATRDGERQPLGVFVGGLAGTCLLLTYVRTLWIFVGVVVLVLLVLERRWGLLAAGASLLLALVAAREQVRARFDDILRVLTLRAPDEGWGAIGSWRGRIWVESVEAYAEGPWWTWLVGRGLGEHVGLHKHLDPHNELLALVFQLGLVGLGLWLWLMGAAARATSGVSNEWLTRATIQWVTFAAVGLAIRQGTSRS